MSLEGSFDAVVVGGGPVGLTGAVYLARFRRSVLVVDEGGGRAVRIPRTHNYPGFAEGIEGTALVAALQHQALRQGTHFAHARVDAIERRPGGFEICFPGGRAHARQVLLATGATDIEPAMPHLDEAVRAGLLRYCPVCDAAEVIDRAVGIVGDGPHAAAEAFYLRHYTSQLTLFLKPRASLDDEERGRLQSAGIAIVDGPTLAIERRGDRIAVLHPGAETVCDALYCALGLYVRSELALRLGARHDDEGALLTGAHQETSVEGLYAAGDVVQGLKQICVGTGQAAIAASAMHLALRAADAQREDAAAAGLRAVR